MGIWASRFENQIESMARATTRARVGAGGRVPQGIGRSVRGRGPLALPSRGRSNVRTARSAAAGETAPFRLIQHKHEAWWFYRYLSQVYDHIVNPGHWTKDMREDALEPALLHVAHKRRLSPLKVIDKARKKPQLKGCTIEEGDAENLRFETNTFDRYVSCGSIEYWPDPQRGIVEAFR